VSPKIQFQIDGSWPTYLSYPYYCLLSNLVVTLVTKNNERKPASQSLKRKMTDYE
jgi:hypothetical protein